MMKIIAVMLALCIGSPCFAGKLDISYKSGGGSGGQPFNYGFKDAVQPKYIPYWIACAAIIAGSILVYRNNKDGIKVRL